MFKVLALLILVADGMIVGKFLSFLIKTFLKDSPFSRLLNVLALIIGGGGYFFYAGYIAFVADVSMVYGAVIVFGPVGITALLLLIAYMFGQKS